MSQHGEHATHTAPEPQGATPAAAPGAEAPEPAAPAPAAPGAEAPGAVFPAATPDAAPSIPDAAADPRLDFLSPAFDAALALATESLQPPVPDAPLLDYVAKFRALLPPEALQLDHHHQQQQQQQEKEPQLQLSEPPGTGQAPDVQAHQQQQQQQCQQQEKEGEQRGGEVERDGAEAAGTGVPPSPSETQTEAEQQRRREEAQAKHEVLKARAVRAVARAEASVPPSLSLQGIMNLVPADTGPLAILHTWVTQQRRVCVTTRHAVGVRGKATGTLRAFDRFMNLLLLDVEENYTVMIKVPRYKQQQPAGSHSGPPAAHAVGTGSSSQPGGAGGSQQQARDEQDRPGGGRVRVRWCRKQEHRYRKMDQVLIKGDSVVTVCAVNAAE